MCYYDMHRFSCGDFKWGHFRAHCNQEYRIGETCGMKLINQTLLVPQKCKICDKIDTKLRRREKLVENVTRWNREAHKFRASIEKAMGEIRGLDSEITVLYDEQKARGKAIGSKRQMHA